MEEKIHEILMNLNRGRIAVSEAQKQILILFNSQNNEPNVSDLDILHCKECGSVDIYGNHSFLRCGDCGATYSGSGK